jgi:hypothetical protein
MPLPAAAYAAYISISSALPAAPVIAGMAVTAGMIATHEPGRIDMVQLKGSPEVAAECVKVNVAALNTRLVAVVQPLNGTATMGVVLKRGVVGEPVLNVVLQEAASGSQAEFRPLMPPDQQPDVITQIIAGC